MSGNELRPICKKDLRHQITSYTCKRCAVGKKSQCPYTSENWHCTWKLGLAHPSKDSLCLTITLTLHRWTAKYTAGTQGQILSIFFPQALIHYLNLSTWAVPKLLATLSNIISKRDKFVKLYHLPTEVNHSGLNSEQEMWKLMAASNSISKCRATITDSPSISLILYPFFLSPTFPLPFFPGTHPFRPSMRSQHCSKWAIPWKHPQHTAEHKSLTDTYKECKKLSIIRHLKGG